MEKAVPRSRSTDRTRPLVYDGTRRHEKKGSDAVTEKRAIISGPGVPTRMHRRRMKQFRAGCESEAMAATATARADRERIRRAGLGHLEPLRPSPGWNAIVIRTFVFPACHWLRHQPSPGRASLPGRTRCRTRTSAAAVWPRPPLCPDRARRNTCRQSTAPTWLPEGRHALLAVDQNCACPPIWFRPSTGPMDCQTQATR